MQVLSAIVGVVLLLVGIAMFMVGCFHHHSAQKYNEGTLRAFGAAVTDALSVPISRNQRVSLSLAGRGMHMDPSCVTECSFAVS